MNKTELKINELFKKVRNFKMESYGMHKRDAASDIQEYMRQVCVDWNNETYEYDLKTPTKQLELLRDYMREEKAYYKEATKNNKAIIKIDFDGMKDKEYHCEVEGDTVTIKKMDSTVYLGYKLIDFNIKEVELS